MVRVHLSTLLGKKRWSVKQLSDVTGIRYNTVLDLYHEMALGVKFEHLEKICEVLECELSDLIEITHKKK